jgi:hypothetical protein
MFSRLKLTAISSHFVWFTVKKVLLILMLSHLKLTAGNSHFVGATIKNAFNLSDFLFDIYSK